jgi:hypothetical protein
MENRVLRGIAIQVRLQRCSFIQSTSPQKRYHSAEFSDKIKLLSGAAGLLDLKSRHSTIVDREL